METLETATQFIEHLVANLSRLHNARLLLYGFYLAMIGSFLTIYYAKRPKDTAPKELFLFGAIIGQAVILMQLVFSYHIQGSNNTLNLIFRTVPFINDLHVQGDSIMAKHELFGVWSPAEYPFSIAIGLMFIGNSIFLYKYYELSKIWRRIFKSLPVGKSIGIILIWIAFLAIPIITWCHLNKIFADHRKAIEKVIIPVISENSSDISARQ